MSQVPNEAQNDLASGYRAAARRGARTNLLQKLVVSALLIAGSILFMLPVYIVVSMSLKTQEEISKSSPWSWPANPNWQNFTTLLTDPEFNFALKFTNTLIYFGILPTIGVTLTAAMVAYPFARLRFRGRDRLFILLLSTMMLPGVVTMIPGYVLNAKLGWIDTFYPFVLPAFFGGGAFNIFLVRQFLMGIPREMDEAAKIDGASYGRVFWQILLPNCGPVLATIAVFSFVGGFRDFLGPLMYLNSPEKMTLEIGLRSLQGIRGTEWNYLMAGSLLVLLPMVVIFLACQRYFIKGITLTGGK
jgi:ABC-type glycerol-3-phosphate transport system permease component